MEQPSNKTIMCSVFFLDIVGYSKRSVTGQISLKERFNSYLSAAIRDVPLSDRIILDTGDGAAINFMGDVEDALKAALSMRSSMLHEDPNIEPPLLVRMGINLGPVRLIRDINGQPNIVGDGINVAQRVMGFADASQILVSRSYFDAVSRLSPQYAGMFHYQGSRTDKHVREHEVYAIGYPGDKTTRPFVVQDGAEIVPSKFANLTGPLAAGWVALVRKIEAGLGALFAHYQQIDPNKRPYFVAGLGVPLVLLMAFGLKVAFREAAPVPTSVVVVRTPGVMLPASAVVAAGTTQRVNVAPTPAPPKVATANTVPPPKPVYVKPKKLTQKEMADLAAHRAASKLLGFARGDNDANMGKIALSCLQGTLFFVDGAQKGKLGAEDMVADVTAGRHVVIAILPSQKLFSQSVSVPAGKILKIRPSMCK